MGLPLMIWYEFFIVMGSYQPDFNTTIMHVGISVFLAVNIYGNMYKLITADIGGRQLVLPSTLTKGWRYCLICVRNAPPRSHHCPLCNFCVFKRDHHCWFVGYCVGFQNHRYYICMIAHCWIAALYGNIYNYDFVMETLGELSIKNILTLFAPHAAWLFGGFELYKFFIRTMSMFGFVLLVMFTVLLRIQIVQMVNGQTRYERSKAIREYSQDWHETVREVLGERHFLVFLLPWFKSRLPGDGTKFKVKEMKQL